MLKLIYADLDDSYTLTAKMFSKHQKNIEMLEEKWVREKAFKYALTQYLQDYDEMDYELYLYVVALFEHSDLSVFEIFQKIRAIKA